MKKTRKRLFLPVLAVAVSLAVLLWFFTAVGQLGSGRAKEGKLQLETALRRAAAACYAAEGIYPPTLDYLTEHYGVQINGELYAVFYEVFADNLIPQITVVEKGHDGS